MFLDLVWLTSNHVWFGQYLEYFNQPLSNFSKMHSGNLSQIALPNMWLLVQIDVWQVAKFDDDSLAITDLKEKFNGFPILEYKKFLILCFFYINLFTYIGSRQKSIFSQTGELFKAGRYFTVREVLESLTTKKYELEKISKFPKIAIFLGFTHLFPRIFGKSRQRISTQTHAFSILLNTERYHQLHISLTV